MKEQPSILVADRNPHVRSFVKREMLKYGYQVQLAKDGRDLFGWIGRDNMIDLLILDPDLPDPDGTRLLRRVLERCPRMPIVVHTDGEVFTPDSLTGRVVVIKKDGNSIEYLKKVVAEILPLHKYQAGNPIC